LSSLSGDRRAGESIYAVGDTSSRFHLTPVAIREGHAFSDSVFGNKPWAVNYNLVPAVVFSTPEVATVGLTELQARAAYERIDVYKRKFRVWPYVATGSSRATLVKIVVDGESRRIVGFIYSRKRPARCSRGSL
jgi:glutathione reductase (NADPH)